MSNKDDILNRLKKSRDNDHQSMAQAGQKIAKAWAEKYADYDELRRVGTCREVDRELFEEDILRDHDPILVATLTLGEMENDDFPYEEVVRFWSEVGAAPKQYGHPAFLRSFVLAVEAFWREYSPQLDGPEAGG